MVGAIINGAYALGLVSFLLGGAAFAQASAPPAPAQTSASSGTMIGQTSTDSQATVGGQVIEVPSPILTLDWEELYTRSAWGRRVTAEIEVTSTDLNRENSRIADDLIAEERDLTARRNSLDAKDFRAEADAFDVRVVGIRRAQETKARAVAARSDVERSAFISNAIGLLDAMIEARGAVVVIDRRAIIRGAGAVDVTADMVARADAAFGDGAALSNAAQAPITPSENVTTP